MYDDRKYMCLSLPPVPGPELLKPCNFQSDARALGTSFDVPNSMGTEALGLGALPGLSLCSVFFIISVNKLVRVSVFLSS